MHRHPLVLASELSGRPVVAIDAGDDVAELKDVVFDPASHRLVGFSLNKRGWFRGRLKATLPAEEIESIGPDAVMVSSESDLTEPDGAPAALSGDDASFSVIGTNVLSEGGQALGVIDDVVVETGAQPEAVGYSVNGPNGTAYVPISAQMALSEENIILPAAADEFIRDDLAGFGAAVSTYRSSLDGAIRDAGDQT